MGVGALKVIENPAFSPRTRQQAARSKRSTASHERKATSRKQKAASNKKQATTASHATSRRQPADSRIQQATKGKQGQQTQQEAKQHQQATFRTIRPRLLESGKVVCTREHRHWHLEICMLHKRNLHFGPRRLLWRFGRALLKNVGV